MGVGQIKRLVMPVQASDDWDLDTNILLNLTTQKSYKISYI